jgi:hypothetical protein
MIGEDPAQRLVERVSRLASLGLGVHDGSVDALGVHGLKQVAETARVHLLRQPQDLVVLRGLEPGSGVRGRGPELLWEPHPGVDDAHSPTSAPCR